MQNKLEVDEVALELATLIHEKYKTSYWGQQLVVQRLKEELERLDREFNESTDD